MSIFNFIFILGIGLCSTPAVSFLHGGDGGHLHDRVETGERKIRALLRKLGRVKYARGARATLTISGRIDVYLSALTILILFPPTLTLFIRACVDVLVGVIVAHTCVRF